MLAPMAAMLTPHMCLDYALIIGVSLPAVLTCTLTPLQLGQGCLLCPSGCVSGTTCNPTQFTCRAHPDPCLMAALHALPHACWLSVELLWTQPIGHTPACTIGPMLACSVPPTLLRLCRSAAHLGSRCARATGAVGVDDTAQHAVIESGAVC
jgi:hypothetical protein